MVSEAGDHRTYPGALGEGGPLTSEKARSVVDFTLENIHHEGETRVKFSASSPIGGTVPSCASYGVSGIPGCSGLSPRDKLLPTFSSPLGWFEMLPQPPQGLV